MLHTKVLLVSLRVLGLKILHGKAKTSSMIILFDGLRKKMNAMSDKVDMLSGEIQLNRLATAQPPLCQDASQPTESSPVELGDKDRSRTRSLKSSDATSCPPDRDNKSAIDASDVGLIELGGVPSFGQMAQDAKAAPHVPGPKSEPKSDPDETPRRRAYRLASVKSMKIQEPSIYNVAFYNVIPYHITLCYTISYNTIQYNTICYNIMSYNTI